MWPSDYVEELSDMMRAIDNAIEITPYGGPSDVQNHINHIEKQLLSMYSLIYNLREKLIDEEWQRDNA